MADLIIGYLQNIALHVVDHTRVNEVLHEEAVHEALHMPMFDDNWENHASRCQMDFEFKSLVSEDKVRTLTTADGCILSPWKSHASEMSGQGSILSMQNLSWHVRLHPKGLRCLWAL